MDRLNDMAGSLGIAGGHLWGLIELGCMIWQEHLYSRWPCVGVDWIGLCMIWQKHMLWQVAVCGG